MKDLELRDLFVLALTTGFASREGFVDPRYGEHTGGFRFTSDTGKYFYKIADQLLVARHTTAKEADKTAPAATEKGSPRGIPTVEDLRTAVNALNEAQGKSVVLRVLGRYGASKVSEVKPNDYEALIADLEKEVSS